MKRILLAALLLMTTLNGFASDRSMDEIINESVAPVTNAVSNVIFFSINLGTDIEYVNGKGNRIFPDEYPFKITTGEGNAPDEVIGKNVWIERGPGDAITLSYPDPENPENELSKSAKMGEEFVLLGQTMTITEGKGSGTGRFGFQYSSIDLPFVLIWLIVGAIFFTFYFRFVNFRKFKMAIDIVRGKYSDPNEKGEVSHFQALTAALSATVGLGNIAGVAIAITMGGPGATFWMIIAGFLGMSSKFVECTLGVKYREVDQNGKVYGGPMHYLKKGLAEKGWPKLGKGFAIFFAVMCIGGSFGGGNMFQSNQAFKQLGQIPFLQGTFLAEQGAVFGLIMAVLVGIVIIGGIKRIANVTDKIVPFMVGIYVVAALAVLFVNIGQVPAAFGVIFEGAFSAKAIAGGIVGVLIAGFKRAAFSNEAGIGSASIAHSAVKTDNPASEGLVALLEPFIDTVVVCTMTALVIIITGKYTETSTADGIALTSSAFGSIITWFPYVLAIAVLLFAFSTMISWSYYGAQSWAFLFGKSKTAEYSYKVIFCLFVILGAAMSLDAVINFSDAMIFAMCFPNIFGLYFMVDVVKAELKKYQDKINSGEIITQK